MNTNQLRGLTGITPKKDYLSEIYAKSSTLPAAKQAEYTKNYNDQNLALQQNYNDIAQQSADAAAKDRERAMWLQGGMLGVNAYNAINDSMGGGLTDKITSGAKGLVDTFTPSSQGGFQGLGIGNPETYSGLMDNGMVSTALDVGQEAWNTGVDYAQTGFNAVKDWAVDTASDVIDLFS